MSNEHQGLLRLARILILCVLLLAVILVVFDRWFGGQMSTVDYWKAVGETVFTFLQTIGVAVAAWWTWHLFVKKRIDYPQAKIELQASHFPLAEGKVCLSLTVLVTNTGNVVVKPRMAEAHVRQLRPLDLRLHPLVSASRDSPLSEDQLQNLRTEGLEIAWPEIGYLVKEWDKPLPTIEPGETEILSFDFVIEDSVQTVRIMSYVSARPGEEAGWRNTIQYNLERSVSSNDAGAEKDLRQHSRRP